MIKGEDDVITIMEPSDHLHSPPLDEGVEDRSYDSSYFPPTSLNYYAPSSFPVYSPIGPTMPPAVLYPRPNIRYHFIFTVKFYVCHTF